MQNQLLELEKRFFDIQYMNDERWLNQMLHEDFQECGKSGVLCYKKETIQALLDFKKNRDIIIYNFNVTAISLNSWIVHYITISEHQQYYRTSIWVKCDQLQLLFHQATRLYQKISLTIS